VNTYTQHVGVCAVCTLLDTVVSLIALGRSDPPEPRIWNGRCLRKYVCIYIRTYIYMYVYIHIYIYTYIYVCVYVCVCVCVQACRYTYAYTYIDI